MTRDKLEHIRDGLETCINDDCVHCDRRANGAYVESLMIDALDCIKALEAQLRQPDPEA